MLKTLNAQSEGAEDAAPLRYNVVELIADWCEGLQGGLPIRHSLRHFMYHLGAEAAMVVKVLHEGNRPTRFLSVDSRVNDPYVPKLKRSYSSCVLRNYLTKATRSSLWLSSEIDNATNSTTDPSLIEWQAVRSLNELAVIVLSNDSQKSEFLELHFHDIVTPRLHQTLDALLPTMCRAWSDRATGVFSAALLDKQRAYSQKDRMQSILSFKNPASLSRAEFRVCMLLSRGASIEAVASELSIAMSTVRSHLGSIYSKTDTSGHAELVYLLLVTQSRDSSLSGMTA